MRQRVNLREQFRRGNALACMNDVRRSGVGFYAAANGEAGPDGTPLDPVQAFMLEDFFADPGSQAGQGRCGRVVAMTPLDRMREYCRQAGIKPGTPLEGALLTIMEACEVTREASVKASAAADGAHGLTPDGEAALVKRVTDRIVGAVHVQLQITISHMRTRALWASAGIIVAGALAIGGGCYYWGRTDGVASVQAIAIGLEDAFKGGPDMAAAWLRLMRANNPVAALAACKTLPATKESGMRRGCWLPMWLDPPAMSPPQF